jgi:hypothetical protein
MIEMIIAIKTWPCISAIPPDEYPEKSYHSPLTDWERNILNC